MMTSKQSSRRKFHLLLMLWCKISMMLNLLHFFHLTVTQRASASKEIWECHVTGHPVPNGEAGWEEKTQGEPHQWWETCFLHLWLFWSEFVQKAQEKVKYCFLPRCVRKCCTSHREGFYVTIKTKLCFTFSNLTEVNAEPINWHMLSQHWCTTFCYWIQVLLPSLVGLLFHTIP